MARVPLPRQEDLPEDYQYLMSEDALGERNVIRAIANNPAVLQSYMRYGTTLWTETALTDRERELVILAVARALDSEYEWHQHVELGREAGVSLAAIRAVGREERDGFDDDERALLDYAAAFAVGEVTDEVSDALAAAYGEATVAAVAMLASHYVATARVLDGLDVPIEGEFVGWVPQED